jgi:hypothetical protein
MVSCRAQGPSESAVEARATAAPLVDGSVSAPRSAPGDDAAVEGVVRLRGCVAHAAQSQEIAATRGGPDGAVIQDRPTGSCAADAECIERQDVTTPGDGFARLSCQGQSCVCTLEALAPDERKTTFHVELEAPCTTSAEAKVILFERCLHVPSTKRAAP